MAEIHSRQQEALRVFRPLPEQERFFASHAPERLALGGNRGGKTVTTLVEIARAVTGQDPHDKYPKTDGIFILVAIDLKKCARVFYKGLFKSGLFKIVPDPVTGEWRGFRPDQDAEIEHLSKPAPPLIPRRFLAGRISFGSVKDEEPKVARLKNGWQIWFYSSNGEMPQGVAVHGVCFDEELSREAWYGEMLLRLVDCRIRDHRTGKIRGGKFIWSATPQAGTPLLYELYSRAFEEQEIAQEAFEKGEPIPTRTIESFSFLMDTNPYIPAHSIETTKNQFRNRPEEYGVRIEGRFALTGARVYPEFMPKGVHGHEAFPIPDDWCRYAIVDPGRQVCAVLFVAIPPPSHPWRGRKVIYDELYLRFCSAPVFAKRFVDKVGDTRIHRGIIDHRAGRVTETGSGLTIEQQYTKSLKDQRFSFEVNGCAFSWASDDVKSGISAVQAMLQVVEGKSELVVLWEKVPSLIWEMDRYCYKRQPNGLTITDDPVKLNDHACDCLRYLAMANLRYVKPRKIEREGYTNKYLRQKRERIRHSRAAENGADGAIKVW